MTKYKMVAVCLKNGIYRHKKEKPKLKKKLVESRNLVLLH